MMQQLKQAFLPESLEESTLLDLLEGEAAYAVPWAMYALSDGSLWLNGNYSFHRAPFGTATMGVQKTSGQYIVDVSRCDHKWTKGDPCFVGEFTPIPVGKLLGA